MDAPVSRRRALTRAALLTLTLGTAALTPGGVVVSSAQTAPDSGAAFGVRMTNFYRAPDLASVPALIEGLASLATDRARVPGVVGFLAGLFSKYPDQIERFLTPEPAEGVRRHILAALFMAGQESAARQRAGRWRIETHPIEGQPRLSSFKPRGPVDFDVLWAASFATGNADYVAAIFDAFAGAANRLEVDPAEVAAIVDFNRTGDPTRIRVIAAKYGPDKTRELVHVSSALWSLRSNAAQHAFVAAVVQQRLAAEGDSAAARTYRFPSR